MAFVQEFRDFAVKGNALDMAVGIILGIAFGDVVKSLVNDIIMPPIGLLLGNTDFSNLYWPLNGGHYATLADARAAGESVIAYGAFLNLVLTFIIVALVLFLVVRRMNRMRSADEEAPAAPSTKTCRYCASAIPLEATRCPHCTSDLAG